MHKVLAHVLHVQNVHVAEIREYMYIYISLDPGPLHIHVKFPNVLNVFMQFRQLLYALRD